MRGYYEVPSRKRWIMGSAYFALVVLLVLAMSVSDRSLKGLRPVLDTDTTHVLPEHFSV